MPACLTHYYFAKQVKEQFLKGEPLDDCAYFWGAQGPDFYFCHRYFPFMRGRSLQEMGHRLHSTRPSRVFHAMRDFLRSHPDPVYHSYVMGFICHYSLDSTAHPYIDFLADALREERPYETRTTMHGEIEAALDAITLRRETGKLPSEVNLKDMFPKNEGVEKKIAKLHQALLFSLYGENAAERELVQAMDDAHLIFACLTDRTGLKRKIFDAVEKGKPHAITSHLVPLTEDDAIDYANIQKEPWGEEGETSDKSFFELFEEALGVAGKLLENLDDGDFKELTGEKTFSGEKEARE